MPQPMNRAVLTNGAAALLARAQAGLCRIEFTRIAIGCGTYAEDEKTLEVLQPMTALRNEKNSYGLSEISVYGEYSVRVTALISNKDPTTGEILVAEGFHINEMGLFAKESGDPDGSTEVLYSIAVTSGESGDYMPPYNGYSPAQIIQEYYATVNNALEVTISVENSGAIALAKDLAELKQYIEERLLEIGRVLIGSAGTSLRKNDTLFVIDGDGLTPEAFQGAAYTNVVFSDAPPSDAANWAEGNSASSAENGQDAGGLSIIQGNLTVAEEPASDTVFFAKINK